MPVIPPSACFLSDIYRRPVVDGRRTRPRGWYRNPDSSCPGLTRASTSLSAAPQGVDARIKSGHDDPPIAVAPARRISPLHRGHGDPAPLLPALHPQLGELHAACAGEEVPAERRVLVEMADGHLPLD